MKYGLLYYKDTDNIGDDIQSYAAAQFLPRIDCLIDREKIELFTPSKKETVKVIMNAWYIHDKFNFDISPYIEPLYISMFFKRFPYEAGITIDKEYLNENIIESLKENGPIGTRDLHTKKVMDELKIKSYFSGCMTLTLKKLKNVKKEDYIVVVGLKKEEIKFIKSQTKRKIVVFKQDVKRGSFKNETWEKRKQRVEETLRLYQGAHMVITTKLHCSLPCLALGTPVLLLYDESFKENEDRIGTYLTYLNYIKREEIYTSNIDFENPKENPKEYLKLRRNLEKKCKNFIHNEISSESKLIEIEDYKFYINKSRNMRKLPIKQLEILQKKYEEECKKSSELYDELNEIKFQYQKMKNRYRLPNYFYEKIAKSKIVNIIKKIKGWNQ